MAIHVPCTSYLRTHLSAVRSLQKVVALKTRCPRTVIAGASLADRYGILRSILKALSSSFTLARTNQHFNLWYVQYVSILVPIVDLTSGNEFGITSFLLT